MRKFKSINLLVAFFMLGTTLFAQSIEEGKRLFNYERYSSARDVFNKLLASNPNNIDAAYWLGQTYIGQEDVASAKALYQKAINANPNSPLLLVGMGQIALTENNIPEAKNRFETAISLTKGKDYNVLNAIARANVDTKAGDAAYAIEKLRSIPENKRTAEMWLTLGDAYRKILDGANAVSSYQVALTTEPNNAQAVARANFMIGRIYQTQGFNQENIYIPYYTQAFTKDPNFAPVFAWLQDYYYTRDINKARQYLDRYIAVADPDAKNCYYQASFLYASRQYQQSINKSNECISAAGGQNVYPKLYGLKAFAYDKLGDSVNAKASFETYFQKQTPDNFGPGDYAAYGRTLLKFPGNEAQAASYVQKAVALDTLEENKVQYITEIANSYSDAKNYEQAGRWFTMLLPIKKNVTKTDLYNAGISFYRGGNYKTSDSLFTIYQQKYPDDILGYYYGAIAKANIDSTSAMGLAIPDYQKIIELASKSTDTAQAKNLLISAYRYFVNYYYNVKKDNATTLSYVNKVLEVDPGNTMALENKKALEAAINSRPTKMKDDREKEKTDDSKVKDNNDKAKAKIPAGKAKVKKK